MSSIDDKYFLKVDGLYLNRNGGLGGRWSARSMTLEEAKREKREYDEKIGHGESEIVSSKSDE